MKKLLLLASLLLVGINPAIALSPGQRAVIFGGSTGCNPVGATIGAKLCRNAGPFIYPPAMASPPTFTVVSSAPSGLTTVLAPVTNDSQISYWGGNVFDASGAYFFAQASANGHGNCCASADFMYNGSVEVAYTGSKMSFQTGVGTYVARMLVNGQYVTTANTTSTGAQSYWTLDFGGVSATRNIKIEYQVGGVAQFWSVRVSPGDTVAKPNYPDKIRAIYIGDSWFNGTQSTIPKNTIPDVASKYLGWVDSWPSGLGGTGYINNGTNLFTYIQRLTDATANSPDVVVVGTAGNDGASTQAQIQTAVVTYAQAVRSALPGVPIFILGCFPGASGPDSIHTNVERAIKAAVLQLNDPLTFFIPIITDPAGPWIYGTGFQGATNGTGNSDFYIGVDGGHPNDAGDQYVGYRIAKAIKAKLRFIP